MTDAVLPAASPDRDPAASRATLRVGVIGAGSWAAANTLPVLMRRADVALVGVARPGPAELDKVRAAFGIPFGTEDYRELLAQVPMDAVVVASPHHLHAEHACAAIEAGCHVLVEKPLATSVADARRILDATARHGRQLLVPYGWSFQPYFKRARRWIEQGRIGRLRHVVAQMATPIEDLMSGGALPGTETGLFQPQPETWASPTTGGYGWGQLVHLLGGLFYLTDLVPDRVFAALGRSARGTDLFDALTLTFADGVTGVVSGSASVPTGSPFQIDIRLFGTDGMILLDTERERLWLRRNDGADDAMAIQPGQGAYTCMTPIETFVDLCQGVPAENCGTGTIGLRSVEVVAAMLRSNETASLVRIGDLG